MKLSQKFLIASLSLLVFAACEKNPIDTLCNPNALNYEFFEEELIEELDGNVMGYAYVIMKNGTVMHEGADGFAINEPGQVVPFTLDQKMQVASVSKHITTVATLAVLEDKNVDSDATIQEYLPSAWTLGTGFGQITFEELLSHSPGMNIIGTQSFSATVFDSLQWYALNGATGPKTPTYSNTHHGMMRVILPDLWGDPRPADGNYDADFFANAYKSCVREYVFDKLDIFNVDCVPPAGQNNVLAYASATDTGGAGGSADFSLVSGGTGWVLTCRELAKYWAYVWNTEEIISEDSRQLMEDNRLGLWNTINGDKGAYLCKLGGWNFGSSKWMNSAVVQYPDGAQLVLFTNSPGKSLSQVARDAYDDAFRCN